MGKGLILHLITNSNPLYLRILCAKLDQWFQKRRWKYEFFRIWHQRRTTDKVHLNLWLRWAGMSLLQFFFCSKWANFREKSIAFIERCANCAHQKCILSTISCRFVPSCFLHQKRVTNSCEICTAIECTLLVIRLHFFNISFIWNWVDSCQYLVYNIYQVNGAGLNFRIIMTNIFKGI